tara:strand:- start:264 stop:497 length:234 start_codon:yes stop_codon:yes gene_type:complete
MKIFAIIVTLSFMLLSTSVNADPVSKVQNWLIAEKNSIVEFQKQSWSDSKTQFANNKKQIGEFWNKIKSGFNTEKVN